MTTLNGFPLVSQLTPITSDGLPSNNAQFDCVAASICASVMYLHGVKVVGGIYTPDNFKDHAYSESYTGGTSASAYISYCAKLGVHLFSKNGTPQELTQLAHQYIQSGLPVIFTIVDPYVPASSGWTHVEVWFAEDAATLTALDPYIAKAVQKTDGEWQPLLRFNQIWIAERITKEQPMTISTTTPALLPISLVGNYFTEEAPDVWYCTIVDPKNPKHYAFHVSHGILAFYRALDPTHMQGHYAGLSILGLPVSAEAYLPGKQDVAYQRFERGVVIFDPRRQMDNPTGTVGDCYLAHIDPLFDAQAQVVSLTNMNRQLSSDADALKSQNGLLETANSALQSQLTAASAQLHSAQQANATLQQQYAALSQEKAALESQPDTATYQAFVRDVTGASAQLQAALSRVSAPAPSSSVQGGQA